MFVAVQNDEAVHVLDRRDGAIETPLLPGEGGALLRLHRIGVHIFSRKTIFGGDEIGGDALRHEIGGNGDRGIDRPGPARGADADAAHALDAAANREIVLTRHDLRGCLLYTSPQNPKTPDLVMCV